MMPKVVLVKVNIDQQLLIKSESDGGIDFESPEMGEKEHTLGSRSKLIVLGDEPSEDSLIEFAKSQGINIAFWNDQLVMNEHSLILS